MEYQLLDAILHGQRLTEPLTWVYLASLVTGGVGAWKLGGFLFDRHQDTRGDE